MDGLHSIYKRLHTSWLCMRHADCNFYVVHWIGSAIHIQHSNITWANSMSGRHHVTNCCLNGYGSASARLSYLQWMNTDRTTHAVMNHNRVYCLCFTGCVVQPMEQHSGPSLLSVCVTCCKNFIVRHDDQLHGSLIIYSHTCAHSDHALTNLGNWILFTCPYIYNSIHNWW